jgi:ATP-dependent Clp protease ATP-binding subunit ClpC
MFERFTDRARRVIVLAQEAARERDHNYIGTEHILLGLVGADGGIAVRVLHSMNITSSEIRAKCDGIVARGDEHPTGHIPFTSRTKKVLELSLRESLQFGHNYIGTEHLLLAVLREGHGVGAQVLTDLGADLPTMRQHVTDVLADAGGGPTGSEHPAPSEHLVESLLRRLTSLETRVAALERRLGAGPDDESGANPTDQTA